jgi:hypothetical protein
MSGAELLAGLLGIVAPAILALFKRLDLSKTAQSGIILAACIVGAGVTMLASGELDPAACSGLDLLDCVSVVYKYLGLVLGGAFVSYKMFWQALGIDDKIAGA